MVKQVTLLKKRSVDYCCAAENYKELANLIIEFCNSDKKEEMAKNSYDYYIRNYSKEKFMSMLEEQLNQLGGIIKCLKIKLY